MAKKETTNVVEEAVAKAKGGNASKAAAPDAEAREGSASNPRPRKHDYGLKPATVLSVVEDKMPENKNDDGQYVIGKGLTEPYNIIAEACKGNKKGLTFNDFEAAGGTRSQARKLMRSGRVVGTGEDGTEYPRDYVKPEPKPKAEKKEKDAA